MDNPVADKPLYQSPQKFTATLNGRAIRFFSRPGIPNWQTVQPSTVLLAENVQAVTGEHLLWIGSYHGAAVASLAQRFPLTQLSILENNEIARQLTRQTLQANQVHNAVMIDEISVLPAQAEQFVAAVIDLPKGRRLLQRYLIEAWHALKPGSFLFLSGANDLGVHSAVKDAATLFGEGTNLAYRKGNRIVRFYKEGHDFPSEPSWLHENHPCNWHPFTIDLPNRNLRLESLPGVFAHNRLDDGTRLLIDHLPDLAGARVVDLGCGVGVIGLLAALAGANTVDLLDVDWLALAAARRNIEAYNLSNARLLASDGLSSVLDQTYDCILSNPPFHSGKGVEFEMARQFIRQSAHVLRPGGELRLVANRFIRYDQVLNTYFHQTRPVAENNQFWVLSAIK